MSRTVFQFKTGFSRLGSLAFLLMAILASGLANAQQMDYQTFTLDNGLTVILVEDHTKPEVFGLVGVKAGGKNDPSDATGMAHYQEHMLFKGTTELGTSDWAKEKVHIDRIFELYDELGLTEDEAKRADIQKEINMESIAAGKYTILNETSSLVKQMGGTHMNAGTGWDETVFYNAFPPSQTARWIDLYSHRFMEPVFRGFQAELEVVYEEKNMYDDNFITPLLNAVNSKIYKKHPYGQQTIIGTTDDLKNPSLTKMYKFFKSHYVANNMAVVMVGDFKTKDVLPMIKEKFGRLPQGNVPEFKKPIEEPFNGREYGEGNFSPVQIALLAFRSVPKGHQDELALSAFTNLLGNENGTGALNKLAQDGKVMEAQSMPMHHNDYGAEIFLVIPRMDGQKMEDAEQIVLDEVRKLRDGDFTEEDVNAIKLEKYRHFVTSMENYEAKATSFFGIFSEGGNLDDFIHRGEKINALTKADLVRVAKKYYGDDYLAFFSKLGFPEKTKLPKPNYDPVSTNTNAKSSYAKHFDAVGETHLEPAFIDLKKDAQVIDVQKGVRLFYVENKLNDIFDLTISFGAGDKEVREASMVASLFNQAGTSKRSKNDIKKEFDQLGCTYYFSGDANFFEVQLSGLEENMEKAISLVADIMNNPVIEEKSFGVAREGIQVSRKMEKEDPANVASALLSYVISGDNSPKIRQMSKVELEGFDIPAFNTAYDKLMKYSADIHFVGQNSPKKVAKWLKNNFKFSKKPIISPYASITPRNEYTENTVFFVPKKDAVQANIYFLINGEEFDAKKIPAASAFNLYFGGGFSGLVLQEIREYRSMAYTASGSYSAARLKGQKDIFIGYVGTQADKTINAIDIYEGLLKDMPEKPERIDYIKPYLAQTAACERPSFRWMSKTIVDIQARGLDHDSSQDKFDFAQDMKFQDIVNFYKENIQGKPRVIMLVGDPKRISKEDLAKYGKVIEVQESELFND